MFLRPFSFGLFVLLEFGMTFFLHILYFVDSVEMYSM